MLVTTEGIVLKQRKIANNRRMICVFTRKYGKLSAGTALNEKGRSKAALAIRPFSYAEYDIYRGRESYSINNAQLKKSYYSIGEDLDRFLVASRFIEYLDLILEEGQARPKLFEMTLEFFDSLTRMKGNYDTLLYAFIIKTLKLQGVMPELKSCVNCGKSLDHFGYNIGDVSGVRAGNTGSSGKAWLFSVSSGGIICEECAKKEESEGSSLIYRPSFDIINVFTYFMEKPIEHFEKVKLKRESAEEIKRIINKYISRYLGAEIFGEDIEWR